MARSAPFFPAIQKAGKSLLSRTAVAIGERLSRWFCLTLVSETNVLGTEIILVLSTAPPDCFLTNEIGKRSLGFARPRPPIVHPTGFGLV